MVFVMHVFRCDGAAGAWRCCTEWAASTRCAASPLLPDRVCVWCLPVLSHPSSPTAPHPRHHHAGTFKLTLEFTEEYPNKAPVVKFKSQMFHPNSASPPPRCFFGGGGVGCWSMQSAAVEGGRRSAVQEFYHLRNRTAHAPPLPPSPALPRSLTPSNIHSRAPTPSPTPLLHTPPPPPRTPQPPHPPAVYADGGICLDILQNQWSPIYDVSAILTSIQVRASLHACMGRAWGADACMGRAWGVHAGLGWAEGGGGACGRVRRRSAV